MTVLKEISEPDVKFIAESWLAGAWLGVPVSESLVKIEKKHDSRAMMRIEP